MPQAERPVIPSALKPYLYLLLAVLLAGSHIFAFHLGGEHTRAETAKAQTALLTSAFHTAQLEQRRAAEVDKALQELLNAPKAAPRIQTLVRDNPDSCPIPVPVAAGLRDAISEANARIKASRSDAVLP
jgi:hypothetical protein